MRSSIIEIHHHQSAFGQRHPVVIQQKRIRNKSRWLSAGYTCAKKLTSMARPNVPTIETLSLLYGMLYL